MSKTATGSCTVRTNSTPGSVFCIKVEPIKFADLWANYPKTNPCDAKGKNGRTLFNDQCAIRLSAALKRSGATFKSYPKNRKCWIHPDQDHILAARELANWLEKIPFVGCRKSEDVTGRNWQEKIAGHTGIICFEDYYRASGGNGGDHIDLWNESKMTGFWGWARIRFPGASSIFLSDVGKARRIRFFAID
jgi:hypothetical protein